MGWKTPRPNKKTSTKEQLQNGGMKAPDIATLDCALRVKHYTIDVRPDGMGSLGIVVEWAGCRKLGFYLGSPKQENLQNGGL